MIKVQVVEELMYIVREVPASFTGEYVEIVSQLFNEVIDAQLRLREVNQYLVEFLEGETDES